MPHKVSTAQRSRHERDTLTLANLGLVCKAVRSLSAAQVRRLGGHDDATSVGTVALLHAAELWDENSTARFSTYAYTAIVRRLWAEVADSGLIRVPYRARHVEDAERAERIERIADKEQRLIAPGCQCRIDLAIDLRVALRTLTKRERRVVVGKFVQGRTQGELSGPLRCSESWVWQLGKDGLEKLRRGGLVAWS